VFLVLLFVAMMVGVVLMRSGQSTDPGAAAGSVSGAPVPQSLEAEPGLPTSPPSDVTWQTLGKSAVPVSRSAGPFRVNDKTAAGYAHTPVGAIVAAAQLGLRSDFYAGRPIWEATITEQFVPGRNRDRLLERMRSRAPEPAGAPLTQIAGFLYQAYSADTAVIGLMFQAIGAGDSKFITTVTLQWRGGDWRMVAPPDGAWGSLVHWAEDWTGAVPWGPPASTTGSGQGGGTAGGGQGGGLPVVTVVLKAPCNGQSSCDTTDPTVYCKDRQNRNEASGIVDICAAGRNDWLKPSDREIYDKADKACKDDNGLFGRGKCFEIDGEDCYIRESSYCDPIYGKQNERNDKQCKDSAIWGKCYDMDPDPNSVKECYDYGWRSDLSECAKFYTPPGGGWVDELIMKDLKSSLKWAFRSLVNFWIELPPPNLSDCPSVPSTCEAGESGSQNPVYWMRQRIGWLIGFTAV
jgi:hypothetical protein